MRKVSSDLVTIGRILEAIEKDCEEEWRRLASAWLKTPVPNGIDPVSKHFRTLRKAVEQALECNIREGYKLLLSVLAKDPGFSWGRALAAAAVWAEKLGYEEDAKILREELTFYTESWTTASERSLRSWIKGVQQLSKPTTSIAGETLRLPPQTAVISNTLHTVQGENYELKINTFPDFPNVLSIYVQYIGKGLPPQAVQIQLGKDPFNEANLPPQKFGKQRVRRTEQATHPVAASAHLDSVAYSSTPRALSLRDWVMVDLDVAGKGKINVMLPSAARERDLFIKIEPIKPEGTSK